MHIPLVFSIYYNICLYMQIILILVLCKTADLTTTFLELIHCYFPEKRVYKKSLLYNANS